MHELTSLIRQRAMRPPWSLIAAAIVMATELAGCATIAASHQATPLDERGRPANSARTKSGLVISGEEADSMASRYFGAIRVTFENRSSRWVHIRKMRVDFGTAAKNAAILLPWGSDIDSWMEATLHRNEIRKANANTTLVLFALGGTVANRAAGYDNAVGATGGLIAAGALGIATADAISAPAAAANSPPLFPGSHLLAVPFSVPPGLFANKWILVQTPDPTKPGCLRSMILDYETDTGERERVLLEFRSNEERSEWQLRGCTPTRADST